MRPIPQDVNDIGWNELSPRLGGGESRVLELLREIYEGEDLEERETALDTGYQWFDTLSTPAAQWIKSLLPLLSDEREPLRPSVLMYLSLYTDRSVPARGASEEEIETALTVIEAFPDRAALGSGAAHKLPGPCGRIPPSSLFAVRLSI